ncbi:C-type lectin domain family 2 member D-like [Athene noctua]|uniref:C-type lectin domain family 2 member D-like n=1 Tax=Athene noctua TaxID=126797 RepID=UPI003EBA8526
MAGRERSSFSSVDVEVETALALCDGGVTPTELPGDPQERTQRRLGGKWRPLHGVRVPVLLLVFLVAVTVASAVAAAVLWARPGACPAPVLACPHEWVGHRGVCYFFSDEEGSWERSQERCSSLGASLAVPKEPGELDFLWRLKGNIDYWVGLRRRGRQLEGVDGSSFTETFPVLGNDPCVYLNDKAVLLLRAVLVLVGSRCCSVTRTCRTG